LAFPPSLRGGGVFSPSFLPPSILLPRLRLSFFKRQRRFPPSPHPQRDGNSPPPLPQSPLFATWVYSFSAGNKAEPSVRSNRGNKLPPPFFPPLAFSSRLSVFEILSSASLLARGLPGRPSSTAFPAPSQPPPPGPFFPQR